MKASNFQVILLLILLGLVGAGCDTTLNIKAPSGSYFVKYFGQAGSQTGVDFIANPDGTFILFGTTRINNNTLFYLAKSDAMGNMIWDKTFPNGGITTDCQARDIELLANGTSFVVVGNVIQQGNTDYDVYVATFQDSTITGSNVIGTGDGYVDVFSKLPTNENAATITETNDGFIVAGSTGNIARSDNNTIKSLPLLMRLNGADLKPYLGGAWYNKNAATYGQATESVSTKIVQLSSKTFYVFGYSRYNKSGLTPDFNFWTFSMDSTASPNNAVGYYGSTGSDMKLFSVTTVDFVNSGFFLGGLQTDAVNGDRLYFTRLKPPPLAFDETLDPSTIQPQAMPIRLGSLKTILNAPYPSNERVNVAPASDGFLLLTNEVTTGNSNMFLNKVTLLGDQFPSWNTPVVLGGQGDDFAGAVQVLPDGKIVLIGTMTVGQVSGINSETKMVLIKLNQSGQLAN